MRRALIGLLLSASLAVAGGAQHAGKLLGTPLSFAASSFCQLYGCRLLSKQAVNAEASGFADFVRYEYRTHSGTLVRINRYDPAKNRVAGNVIADAELRMPRGDLTGRGVEQARAFVHTIAGVQLGAGDFERCVRASAVNVNHEARLYGNETNTEVGVKCSLSGESTRQVSIRVFDPLQ